MLYQSAQLFYPKLAATALIFMSLGMSQAWSQVKINEVMVKPGSNSTSAQFQSMKDCANPTYGSEYIELYNANPCDTIDISCFLIATPYNGVSANSGGTFRFPAGTRIPPLGFLSIGGASSGANILLPNFCAGPNAPYLATGGSRWYLDNFDTYIALYNASGTPVDVVYWTLSAGQASRWNDPAYDGLYNAPTSIPNPAACANISSLAGPSTIPSGVLNYAGAVPNMGFVIHRTTDGAATWATNANASLNACNGTCVAAGGLTISNVSSSPASCGNSNGSASVTVGSGTAPYAYIWSNGATSASITGLAAGTYQATITDGVGCSTNIQVTVGFSNAFTLNLSGTNASCFASNNATASATVSGGSAPFTYIWSNGQTSATISALAAGQYAVTVTDNSGCQSADTLQVTAPAALSLSHVPTNLSCQAAANGAINLTVSGGTLPYSFVWSNASTAEDQNGLSAGIYSATVTDANGCSLAQSAITITEPAAITLIDTVLVNASCGNSDGSISIVVGGGTPSYSYQWSNNATSQNITGLAGGLSYDVIVTDANGCSQVFNNLFVGSSSNISLSATATPTQCGQPNAGAIDLTVTSGTMPYTFAWSNGVTTEDLTNLSAAVYTVTVSDNLGCTTTATATVTTPLQPSIQPIILSSNATDTTILLGASLTLNSGNDQSAQGVSYFWTFNGPGSAGFSAQNAAQTTIQSTAVGAYTFVLTATSADGCISTDSLHVSVEELGNPQIPTAFTPNNEGGNETFRVVELDKNYLLEFKIFNRWGQLIYDNAVEGEWDGTFKDTKQPTDLYMYIISWKRPLDSNNTVIRGHVTLLR